VVVFEFDPGVVKIPYQNDKGNHGDDLDDISGFNNIILS
jgi:hypothetical protein